MFPSPPMDARSRAFQGVAKRDRQRDAERQRRAAAAARSAANYLRQAAGCLDRADRALRKVEGQEGDKAIETEHAATAVRRAYERCQSAARGACAAARRGDARRAEGFAGEAASAASEAAAHATAARKAAR